MSTQTTFCRICEALCGLEAEVDGDAVTALRPDPAHVATRGQACVKGLRQHRIYASPDRLTQPLKRVGSRYEPISWQQALREIGGTVAALRATYHPDAVAMYVGTAAGFSVLHPIFAQGFMTGVGSQSMYSSSTQDCANKFAVSEAMYGFLFALPFPDVDRTRCLILVGGNPAISRWSFGQVSHPMRRLQAIERRGGRVFVVDPRRTETARAVGQHRFIRPGTDVFFLLSFLQEVLSRGAARRDLIRRHMRGLAPLEALADAWPPERTAAVTGIDPDALRTMVQAYVAADGAALYCSTGVNMGGAGSLAFWIAEAINAITGNLDRPGGTLVGRGILDLRTLARLGGPLMRPARSRVGGLPRVNGAFPAGLLADEIRTPGRRQVRALFVTGGNPLLTVPGAARLRDALRSLELLVSVDLFLNETASEAHYVLPATSPLERADLPFLGPLLLGLQSRPYLQATRALIPPPGEARGETTLYLDLAAASGVPLFGSRLAHGLLWAARRLAGRVPDERILDLLLRATRQPGFSRLAAHAHGLPLTPLAADTFLGRRVCTADGRVDLAPPALLRGAERLEARFARARQRSGFQLISKRQTTTHNSWTHNLPELVRQGTNRLSMHPGDAARLGLRPGDLADVSTRSGTIRLPVALTETLLPGVVALPHGWGHQHARGLRIASAARGVNVNLILPDGPGALEPESGMAHLTAVDVQIRPAAGPLDPRSWSGIPAAEEP